MKSVRQYLGDNIYANFDGYYIVLTVEDKASFSTNLTSNKIYLEPEVVHALEQYIKYIKENPSNESNHAAPVSS
jgi:hypothetical protein